MATRSKDHTLLGSPSLFPNLVLPTLSEVLKRIAVSKQTLIEDQGIKFPTREEIVKPVMTELLERWKEASIPTRDIGAVQSSLIKTYETAMKKNKFEVEMSSLYDICTCRCVRVSCEAAQCSADNCDDIHIIHNKFKDKCLGEVPKIELPFLFDQRSSRKMRIGGVDFEVTRVLQETEARKERSEKRKAEEQARREKEKNRVSSEKEKNLEAEKQVFGSEFENSHPRDQNVGQEPLPPSALPTVLEAPTPDEDLTPAPAPNLVPIPAQVAALAPDPALAPVTDSVPLMTESQDPEQASVTGKEQAVKPKKILKKADENEE